MKSAERDVEVGGSLGQFQSSDTIKVIPRRKWPHPLSQLLMSQGILKALGNLNDQIGSTPKPLVTDPI